MKSNDLLYLAVIGGLGYLLYKNSQKPTADAGTTTDGGSGTGTPPPSLFLQGLLPAPELSGEIKLICGNEFSIPYGTIGNSTKYSSIDGKYYRQAMGSAIRTVPAEITLLEFQNACASFKTLPLLKPLKDEIIVMPLLQGNAVVEAVSNFNGTLIRGVM